MPTCCYCCPYSYTTRKNSRWWLICLATTLTAAVIVAGVGLLVLRFAVNPRLKADVEDTRLSSFSFANNTTSSLAYNISLALTVGNPNVAYVKYTKPLVVYLVFHDRRLYNTTVMDEGRLHPPFKKKLRLLHAVGEVPPHVLDAVVAQDLKNQNGTGVFNVEVRLSGEIAYLGIDVIRNKRKLGFSCPLNLSLAPPGPEVVVFRKVSCKLEEPDKIYF